MNNLIIFDIDGTLTDTNQVDSNYFEKALLAKLAIQFIDNEWHNYKYSTDTGLVTEIIQSEFGRDPFPQEISAIQEHFVDELETAFFEDASKCLPLEGATEIFSRLIQSGWDIGIATGGWQKSALLKLKTAHIPYEGIPIAHSDDHIERDQIISIAIDRAKNHYKRSSYNKVIYLGDRTWDKKAANKMGIGFIGIGDELGKITEKDFYHITSYTGNGLSQYLQNYIKE